MIDQFVEFLQKNPVAAGATITSVVAALVSVSNTYLSSRHSRRLSIHNAIQEYKYTARKQIYSETEPLIFQLHEDAEHTVNRLNRVSNQERWPNGAYRPTRKKGKKDNLLCPHVDGVTDLLVIFTAYRILLPLLYHRILKHKLTFLDYSLETNWRLYIINHLLLLYYYTFGDTKEFAENRQGDPDIIPPEELDLAIDEMIAAGSRNQHPDQPISFYEFIQLYDNLPNGTSYCALNRIVDFYNRDPMKRPVLQKVMFAQICIMYVIHKTCGIIGKNETVVEEIRHALDGRVAPWAKEFKRDAFGSGRKYFQQRLGFLDQFSRQFTTKLHGISTIILKIPVVRDLFSRSRMQKGRRYTGKMVNMFARRGMALGVRDVLRRALYRLKLKRK